jgi:prevent-host-death family protein
MATVNVHEAKTHLSALLERASAGERIIIARAGKPVAVLGPIAPASKERKPGLLKGRVRIARNFDAPLPRALRDAFNTGDVEPE